MHAFCGCMSPMQSFGSWFYTSRITIKCLTFTLISLRYHGRWIFKKNAKNLFFAVQIEKTEKNNLQKEWRKKLFLLFTIKRKIFLNLIKPLTAR